MSIIAGGQNPDVGNKCRRACGRDLANSENRRDLPGPGPYKW